MKTIVIEFKKLFDKDYKRLIKPDKKSTEPIELEKGEKLETDTRSSECMYKTEQ